MQIMNMPTLLRWLLMPVILVIAASVVLFIFGVSSSTESAMLFAALSTLFCSAPGLIIAFLSSRSYMLSGSRSVLLLGTGGLVLALGFLAGGPLMAAPNEGITVYNTCLLLSSGLFMGSAICALKQRHSDAFAPDLAQRMISAYTGAIIVVVAIIVTTLAGLIPEYVISGEGLTALCQIVVGLAAAISLGAFLLFASAARRSSSRMHVCVAAGMCSLGVGLAIVALTQALPGSTMDWVARSGQWLGGLYLLVGVLTLERPVREWAFSLEGALNAVEDRYQKLVDLNPLGILVQANGQCMFANRALADILGVENEKALIGHSVLGWVDQEQCPHAQKYFEPVKGEASGSPHEVVMTRSDGTPLFAEVISIPIEFGGHHAVQVLVRDATLRRKTEAALRASEERFRTLVERAPVGILVQVNGTFVYANEAAEKLFRVREGTSLLGVSANTYVPPDYRDLAAERMRIANEDRREVPMNEEAILTQTGDYLNVEVTAVPLVYGGENSALIFMSDITERKQKVDEATRLNRILDGSLNEIYLFDAESLHFVQVNHGARKNLGYTMEELREMTPLDLKPLFDRESFYEILDLLKSGREQVMVFFAEHRRKNGSFYPVEVHLQYTADEKQPIFVAIIMDITERRQAEEALAQSEEQLRQSQKMEAIGRLAGGVAHDFNNLLTAIFGYSDLILARREELDDQTMADVVEIRRVAERASTLTKQILAFSRKQPLQPEVVCLNNVLAAIEPLLRRTIGEDVNLQILKQPDLGLAEVDVHQLEQALLNLAVNARDAMPHGGQLTLQTANVEIAEDYCHTQRDTIPGDYMMLCVSDNGVGMDAQTMSHIFEPFFTTKAPGEGTGLGLSTVYGIVRQSGGTISVHSELGQGTRFNIYLPRVTSKSKPVPAATPLHSGKIGGKRILVVEDEISLRSLITRILSGLGYEVWSAASAKEALNMAATVTRPPDLLLTDVVLPGELQGNRLAQELLSYWPALPVLFMSGYTRDAIVHAGRLDEGVNFLGKPFTPETLEAKVAEVLRAK